MHPWGKISRRKAEKTRRVAKNCLCFVVKPNTKVEDRERQAQMASKDLTRIQKIRENQKMALQVLRRSKIL